MIILRTCINKDKTKYLFVIYLYPYCSMRIGRFSKDNVTSRTTARSRKIFWDHFSKSLVTIQVFTSETWAPTRLKNGGKLSL